MPIYFDKATVAEWKREGIETEVFDYTKTKHTETRVYLAKGKLLKTIPLKKKKLANSNAKEMLDTYALVMKHYKLQQAGVVCP